MRKSTSVKIRIGSFNKIWRFFIWQVYAKTCIGALPVIITLKITALKSTIVESVNAVDIHKEPVNADDILSNPVNADDSPERYTKNL
jgi:hypothetical protein